MATVFELFLGVFNPIAIIYAIAAGLSFGATVLLYLVITHPPRLIVSTWASAIGASGVFVIAGTLFFAGQLAEIVARGDDLWPRALARMALWEVFAISVGIGLGFARSFAVKHRPTRVSTKVDDAELRVILDKYK